MPLLFSYGTLQQEDVQLSTFGRRLRGRRDELPGFVQSRVPIRDAKLATASGRTHNANVTFNGRAESRVSGTVLEITDAELAAADRYEEQAAYARIAVTLASGKQAWVYVDAFSRTAGYPMRLIKIVLVAGVALFLTLAVLGNVTMSDVAIGAVKTAVGMETTFKHPAAMWRAVTSPFWIYVIYGVIVLSEAIAAALCWMGAFRLWAARSDSAAFVRATTTARIGLGVTAALYFLGWLVIASEWFEMWQSQQLNVLPDAFRIFGSVMLILLLVSEREG
jgi:predicted small integral membrane protein